MKSTRHLVHPQLQILLEQDLTLDTREENIGALRDNFREVSPDPATFMRDDVILEERHVPGLNGAPDVRFFLYRPKDTETVLPVFLHLHGGGHFAGDAESAGLQNFPFAAEIPCVVASVDYRLTPETKAPGSVEDGYAVLEYLFDNATELSIDKSRIAVGGESAGAHIAASLALMARDKRKVPLVHQQLIYPMLDDRTVTDGHQLDYTGEFIWTRQNNRDAWNMLLTKVPGSADVNAYEAPARATDLEGVAPAYIWVGQLDLFVEECLDYARRLMAAGVPTELHVQPGFIHGAELVLRDPPVCQRALQERFNALKSALYPPADTMD